MPTGKILVINIFVLLCAASSGSAQTWTPLQNPYPGSAAGPCLLLTNGTVACNDSRDPLSGRASRAGDQFDQKGPANPNLWYRLTPDSKGSYVNGTWSTMPNLPQGYAPIYYASAVLKDGRLIIVGGEINNGSYVWTNRGALYDPKLDTWVEVDNNAATGLMGDSQSVIFPDGTFMVVGSVSNTTVAVLNPNVPACLPNCYSLVTSTGKADQNDEEGWTLMPNGDILTVNAVASPGSQTYNQASGIWTNRGNTGNCQMEDPASEELGPQVLRPDGTVVVFGAATVTRPGACVEVYNTATQSWETDPNVSFPDGLDVADGPASLLPNGNVLVMASPGVFKAGAHFFEWNGTSLTQVVDPPNAPIDTSYYGHMVILPTGEVMFTDYSGDVELYTTSGTFMDSWRPTITNIPFLNGHAALFAGGTFEIDGTQFNGLSQGAAYGDDVQTATNYPLVRATKLTDGTVHYWKTHDHSTMAVATGAAPVSTKFDIPNNAALGLYSVQVVANGIPSANRTVSVCSGAIVPRNACF